MLETEVKILNKSKNPLPEYAHVGDSGFDLRADIEESVHLHCCDTVIIPTGIYVEIPEGYEIQIRSRSGLAAKEKAFVLNSPGTIDSAYRSQIFVILTNLNNDGSRLTINPGDRIAQAVLCPVIRARFVEVDTLSTTVRGEGGLGSTGVQ